MRHAPERHQLELDRFCYELIKDDVCFLYGDTYYTEDSIEFICRVKVDSIQFFGTESSIVAVKAGSGSKLRSCIDELFALIEAGVISDAKGWQLYHLFQGMPLEGKKIDRNYILLNDSTTDFNWPADYDEFIKEEHADE